MSIFFSLIDAYFLPKTYAFAEAVAIDSYPDANKDHKVSERKSKCDINLEEWLKCNNLRVIHYLTKLSKKDRNKIVKGVLLTDGTREMQDYIFLGEARGIGKGVHLYIFEYEKKRSAYLWVDKGGTAFPLPECPARPEEDLFESAYVLSGDVYTWKLAQPGDDVVHVMCVENSWIKKANEGGQSGRP